VEIDESVVAIGQTIDLISEFALAPVVDVINNAGALGESSLDTLHHASASLVVNRRSNNKQQFISLHQLTSFGLYGSGLVKATPEQE
jgi:lysozyme family protein